MSAQLTHFQKQLLRTILALRAEPSSWPVVVCFDAGVPCGHTRIDSSNDVFCVPKSYVQVVHKVSVHPNNRDDATLVAQIANIVESGKESK